MTFSIVKIQAGVEGFAPKEEDPDNFYLYLRIGEVIKLPVSRNVIRELVPSFGDILFLELTQEERD